MQITIDDIMALRPCYSRARIEELAAGQTHTTLEEILLRQDIPPSDRVWVAVRVLHVGWVSVFAEDCAKRASELDETSELTLRARRCARIVRATERDLLENGTADLNRYTVEMVEDAAGFEEGDAVERAVAGGSVICAMNARAVVGWAYDGADDSRARETILYVEGELDKLVRLLDKGVTHALEAADAAASIAGSVAADEAEAAAEGEIADAVQRGEVRSEARYRAEQAERARQIEVLRGLLDRE